MKTFNVGDKVTYTSPTATKIEGGKTVPVTEDYYVVEASKNGVTKVSTIPNSTIGNYVNSKYLS